MGKEVDRRVVSKSEYARHRGVSPAMVTHWSKSARLVLVDGKVDLVATDALLAATLDPTRGGKGGRPAAQREASKAKPAAADQVTTPAVITETPMSRATASDREASASLKMLRLGREAGRLVDRKNFEATTEEVFAAVRDSLMGLPVKLATVLAAATDERRVMDILRDAIEKTLNERADLEDALAERAGATSQ